MMFISAEKASTPRGLVSVIEQMTVEYSGKDHTVAAKKEDRRVQRTRQLLREALFSLIQEKGFEALSVQEIIDRANVGRATFYAYFDNKGDLLVSGLDGLRASLEERQRKALSGEAGADDRLFAFSHELFAHASGHRELFRAMVGKRSGALVQQMLRKMIVDLVRDEVTAMASPRETGSAPTEAVVQFLAGGLHGLLIWWVAGKMRPSVEEVNAIFRRLAVPTVKAGLR